MGTPTALEEVHHDSNGAGQGSGTDAVVAGLLGQLDEILGDLNQRDRAASARSALEAADQRQFFADFDTACSDEIRPAMKTVLQRLVAGGGGGAIEEHPGGEARCLTPRLTLWMSLQGPIDGIARPDRHPYLQFDAEVERREVRVSEGDMWRGAGGGRSGPIGAWKLNEISKDRITAELLGIVRRSAGVAEAPPADPEPDTAPAS